jgi:hypothetical protein
VVNSRNQFTEGSAPTRKGPVRDVAGSANRAARAPWFIISSRPRLSRIGRPILACQWGPNPSVDIKDDFTPVVTFAGLVSGGDVVRELDESART